MDNTKTALRNSLFVATGAFAGTMLFTSRTNMHPSLNTQSWVLQGLFGALGGWSAALMGSQIVKQCCN